MVQVTTGLLKWPNSILTIVNKINVNYNQIKLFGSIIVCPQYNFMPSFIFLERKADFVRKLHFKPLLSILFYSLIYIQWRYPRYMFVIGDKMPLSLKFNL